MGDAGRVETNTDRRGHLPRLLLALVAALALALAGGLAVRAERAEAGLLSSITKAVSQVTAPVTTALQPVVNTTTSTPSTTSTTTSTNPLGQLTADLTTTLSTTVDTVLTPLVPPATADALNVIPAGYDPISPLVAMLGGQVGLTPVLQSLLCPPVTEIAELLGLAGGNAIGDGLTSLACSLGFLEYRFFTRFRAGDGSMVEREHDAVIGVPTALDVDQDVGPDLIGTITLTGSNSAGLTVDRFPGETATLPVSVEAILRDPTGGAFGREHVAFGYDARDDRAPDGFTLSTPVDRILQPSPDFQLQIAQRGRGERIALLGGLFDGTARQRLNPAEVRLDYGRSPDAATVAAAIGGSDVHLGLTTNRPGPADITGRIVEATDEERFAAGLDDLPSSLDVDVAQADGMDATITSSAPIAHLDAAFERVSTAGPVVDILQKAVVDLTSVPVGVRVRMGGEQGEVTTTGGPIGHTKVGVADGEPRFLTGEPAYANLDEDADARSTAVEIPGLSRATFALGDAPQLSAEITPTPFLVRLAEPGRTLNARIQDLPAHFDIGLDLAAGRITYDGHGDGIGRIALDGVSDEPFLGRATHLTGALEGIPATMTATFALADGGGELRIDGGEPLDLIELVAASRPAQADDLPAGGEQGVKLTDLTGGEFVLAARVSGLRRVGATLTGTAIALSTHTAGGPFGVRVTTDELTGLARILDLPAQLDATFDLAAGRLTLAGRNDSGDPQGIARVTLDATSSTPLFGRATTLGANLEDLPSDLELQLAQAGSGAEVTASAPIGLIELVAANRAPEAADLPAGDAQGARLVDLTGGDYVVAARVRELQRLAVAFDQALSLEARTAGGPFHVDVETDDLRAAARLLDLPADVAVTFDAAAGSFRYRGLNGSGNPAGVGEVLLDVDSDTPLFSRATHLNARILDLAPEVDLSLDGAGPRFTLTASAPITRLELVATDDGSTTLPAPLDDPGVQGAVLRDRTGQPFVAALRVLGLRALDLAFGGEDITLDATTQGSPFAVDVDTDAVGISSQILDLPARAQLQIDLAAGQVAFTGANAAGDPQGIDLMTLAGRFATPFLGRANRVSARIEQLPAQVQLGFSQEAGEASLTASSPIQLLELFAWEDGQPQPVLAAPQGALLHDRSGQPYELAARVRMLERLAVEFGDTVRLATKTQGGQFTADVVTETLSADALIDELPSELELAFDLASGQVSYTGAAPINRIFAAVDSVDPVFLGATAFEVDLQQVPTAFTLGLGSELDTISLSADEPIGQIDVRARSANRSYPAIPAGEAGAILDATNDELALGLRVFQLRRLEVALDPIALEAEMQAGRKFTLDARLPAPDGGAGVLDVEGVIDQLPSTVRLALEDNPGPSPGTTNGTRLALEGSAPIGFVRLAAEGVELLPGASKVEAELNSIPEKLTVTLPDTGSLARVEARNAANALTPIGQIRLAASDGSQALPAFVSDAQYNANPSNTGFRDRLEFEDTGSAFGVAVRLTAPKLLDINLDPIALTLEQDGARTRPVAIDATLPNSTAGQPATTVTGVLNKPSARTVLGVTVVPGQPTRLNFENAANVASLSLTANNLGAIPAASFSLSNIPTRLTVCLNTDGQCRRTDRLPSALPTYSGTGRSPAQSGTAGGLNRPYPAQVSMSFDDQGTSGSSSSISSMVTLNASITLNPSAPPITITNLRFHALALDLGQHTTSPTFGFLGSDVPRIYMFIDSVAKPFVMNEVKYPPTIESFRIGTDGSPANANTRLVWLPGTRCTAIVFGGCVPPPLLDPRTTGSLSCGGQRNLTIKVLGLNINLLDFLGLQILPVCS